MNIKIKFNDKTYKYLLRTSKRKLVQVYPLLENTEGVCRVEYSKTFYNEFDFNGLDDFKKKIEPCMDKDLVKEFSNVQIRS